MIKKLLLTLALLTGAAWAQGGATSGTAQFPNGAFVPVASIRVCEVPASGPTCSNLAPLFTDNTLAVTQVNPIILAPQNYGQYSFGVPAGCYVVQVSGVGLNSYSYPLCSYVNQLNYQKSAAALNGNSSAQALFTYTLAANMMQAGRGIRITAGFTHSTGSTSTTYALAIGLTSITLFADTTTTAQAITVDFMNDPGSQTSNAALVLINTAGGSGANFQTTAVNTTISNVIALTFTVAPGDFVTPDFFMVESISQ